MEEWIQALSTSGAESSSQIHDQSCQTLFLHVWRIIETRLCLYSTIGSGAVLTLCTKTWAMLIKRVYCTENREIIDGASASCHYISVSVAAVLAVACVGPDECLRISGNPIMLLQELPTNLRLVPGWRPGGGDRRAHPLTR
jgi:hypothetical protein